MKKHIAEVSAIGEREREREVLWKNLMGLEARNLMSREAWVKKDKGKGKFGDLTLDGHADITF